MREFDILEWYGIDAGRASVGVDLSEDATTLDDLFLRFVTLRRGERSKLVKVVNVEYPIPRHMPPYRRGERIGLIVEFEGNQDGSGA